MLTRQQSERKHKEMLIDEGQDDDKQEEAAMKKSQDGSLSGSKISYFQRSSPKDKKDSKFD